MNRIVLLHLEALTCIPAMRDLFKDYGDQIGLVVLSDRFSSKHGGHWRQFWRNVNLSGLRFTIAYAVDLLTPRLIDHLSRPIAAITAGRIRPCSIAQIARQCGIPAIREGKINSPRALRAIKDYGPTIVLSMHFDQILSDDFIRDVGVPIVNVHPGSIPDQRGPCPTFWTLQRELQEATVTVHRIVDATIDTGPLLTTETYPLVRGTTNAGLIRFLFQKAVRMVEAALSPRDALSDASASNGMAHNIPRPEAYLSFPDRAAVTTFRSRGGRFWTFGEYLQLVRTTLR